MNSTHLDSLTVFMLHFAHRHVSLTNTFRNYPVAQYRIQLIKIF